MNEQTGGQPMPAQRLNPLNDYLFLKIMGEKGDKEALREYHLREMALSDWTSGVNYARREGRAEGRKEGMVEGRKEGIAEGRKEGRVEGRKEGAQEFLDLLVQGKTIEEARRILRLE